MSCDVKFSEDDFPFTSASQTIRLAPSSLVLPLPDSSYLNIYFPPISSSPSATTSSSTLSSIPSPDSPTNSNLIPLDTSVPLRRSTRTKQLSACYNDYEMSFGANHLTSSSSPNTGTRYPLHHYLSFSRFFPTQRTFLDLIIA